MSWPVQPYAAAPYGAAMQPVTSAYGAAPQAAAAMPNAAANPLAALASVTNTLNAAFPGMLGAQGAAVGGMPFAGGSAMPGMPGPAAEPTMQDTLNFITSGPTAMTPLAVTNSQLEMPMGNSLANGFIPGQSSDKVAEFFADEAPGGGGEGDGAAEGGGDAPKDIKDLLKKAAEAKGGGKSEKSEGSGEADESDEASDADSGEDAPSGSDDDAPATPQMMAALVAKIAEVEKNKDRYRGGSKIQAETVKLDKGVPDNLPGSGG